MSQQLIYYVTADYPPDINAGCIRASAIVARLCESARVVVLTHRHARAQGPEKVIQLPFENPQNQGKLSKRLFRETKFIVVTFLRLLAIPRGATVVVTSPPFFGCLLFAFLPRWKSAHWILDIRDLYPDAFLHSKLLKESHIRYRILKAIANRAYRRADLVLAVCESIQKTIKRRSGGKRVEIVMNGYGSDFQIDPRGVQKQTLFRPPLRIVSHGNFGRFQNVELMNDLVSMTQELSVEYLFVGFGDNLSRINPAPNVYVRPAINHQQIPGFLRTVDVGLSFRTSDEIGRYALPVKVLEYVGMGLPAIIVPRMPDLTKLEDAGALRMFEANEIADIATFLEDLIQFPKLYVEMQNAVYKLRDFYDRSSQVDKAAHLIMDLKNEDCGCSQ